MIFTSGLSSPEGPVSLPDKSWLVVEMGSDRGCITHISPDGKQKRTIARTGRPNGLAVDREGTIWAAESFKPALLRVTMDGRVDVWLTECEGVPFLWPNDLCFGLDGYLYMTDSGITLDEFLPGGQLLSDYSGVHFDGRVYRINVKTKEITCFDSGIRFTNGIAFGADNYLYVNETISGNVYRYAWNDGRMGARMNFGNVIDPEAPPGYKGPDGMKFGSDGKLYVTVVNQGDVTVLGTDGSVVQRIKTAGNFPTNIAFGPSHEKRIYVTENQYGTVEVHDVNTEGLPLYMG